MISHSSGILKCALRLLYYIYAQLIASECISECSTNVRRSQINFDICGWNMDGPSLYDFTEATVYYYIGIVQVYALEPLDYRSHIYSIHSSVI